MSSIAVSLLSLLLVQAASPVADAAAVRAIVSDRSAPSAPGCAVGAFRGGRPVLKTYAGYRDLAASQPIDGDTLFYGASLSKQFAVIGLAQLIVQKKIGLDEDIRRLLPEMPAYEVPVTPRMLMQHTAGIRDSLTLMALAGVEHSSLSNRKVALDLVLSQKATNFTPGTEYTYSNGGYLLIAELIERASKTPFHAYMRRHVLGPLGMKSSYFLNDAEPTGRTLAHGYLPGEQGFAIHDTFPRFSGSGGLMLSLNDLAKYEFDMAVGGKVLTPAIKKIMLTPGVLTDGKPANAGTGEAAYAGGVWVGRRAGQFMVEHGGGADAFNHMYTRLPERDLAVAVLCNRGDWDARDKLDEIVEVLEGDILTPDTPAGPSGSYYSDELKATYDVALADRQLTVTVTSPYAGQPLTRTFTRNPDGSYSYQGTRVVFEPTFNGFTLSNYRVRAIRFARMR
jgi:CubicO group peptidase (beta-lactamase class C family)